MLAVFTHYCNDNGNEFVVIVFVLYTFVKLREREGQGVDPGRSLKGLL